MTEYLIWMNKRTWLNGKNVKELKEPESPHGIVAESYEELKRIIEKRNIRIEDIAMILTKDEWVKAIDRASFVHGYGYNFWSNAFKPITPNNGNKNNK